MISTNIKSLFKKSKELRNLCFGKKDRFNHTDIGWNYRMTNMQATLGLSQITRINKIVKERQRIGTIYYKLLKNNKFLFIPQPKNSYSNNIYWVVGILIINKKKMLAKKVIKYLKKNKIGSRPFFWPMNKQNIFIKSKFYNSKKFPNSKYISKYGLYLPNYLGIKKKEISFICKKLELIVNSN